MLRNHKELKGILWVISLEILRNPTNSIKEPKGNLRNAREPEETQLNPNEPYKTLWNHIEPFETLRNPLDY